VYPVPDPGLPFLGVHVTPMLDGAVHIGPNAVLAFAREGYRWRDIDVHMVRRMLADPALYGLARRFGRFGLGEYGRSAFRPLFVRAVRRMIPDISGKDLRRTGSGVRAQAVTTTGQLVDDFVISRVRGSIHVLNAPSPAATSSLLIGQVIAADAFQQLGVDDVAQGIRASLKAVTEVAHEEV